MPGLNLVNSAMPKVAFGTWLGVLSMVFTNPTIITTIKACWSMLTGALVFGSSWHFILPELDIWAPTILSNGALRIWGRVRQDGMMTGELFGSVRKSENPCRIALCL